MSQADTHLTAIFEAERTLRRAEKRLLASPTPEVTELLAAAVTEAAKVAEEDERTLRLERLADLCAQVAGPKMVDALFTILDDESPRVRAVAGEALLDVGYDRYAEVARAIEAALNAKRVGHSMGELPWVLAEIGEPSAVPLIGRFLKLDDPNVVASAIEALADLGDPDAIDVIEPFVNDKRQAAVDEFEHETQATIGDLAKEAIAALTALEELALAADEEEEEKRGPKRKS